MVKRRVAVEMDLAGRLICINPSTLKINLRLIKIFRKNPQFHLDLEDGSDDNSLLIDLRGPKEYSIGFEISMISSFRQHKFEAKDSGPFRSGCTVLQLGGIPAGAYSIRPMTFLPGQEGPFILRVHSTCNFSIKLAQS